MDDVAHVDARGVWRDLQDTYCTAGQVPGLPYAREIPICMVHAELQACAAIGARPGTLGDLARRPSPAPLSALLSSPPACCRGDPVKCASNMTCRSVQRNTAFDVAQTDRGFACVSSSMKKSSAVTET